MFSWLFVIILAYFFFSLSSFGDKLILSDRIKPKLYTFYIGIFSLIVVFLVPFVNFGFPEKRVLVWIVLEAVVYLLALYSMFSALERFEVSRVIPTIGAVQPIFILILTWIFWGSQTIKGADFLAFLMLFLGSIVISMDKKPEITRDFLKLTMFSALMFSLDYVFSKLVFLSQPFLQGLIWMRIFTFLFALIFLLDKKLRIQVFSSFDFAQDKKKVALNKNTGFIFLFTQGAGGLAYFLQSFAISLSPVGYLAIINSLRGLQHVFLFTITLFFSLFFPKVLKEEISKKTVIQKILAIFFIIIGLTILAFY